MIFVLLKKLMVFVSLTERCALIITITKKILCVGKVKFMIFRYANKKAEDFFELRTEPKYKEKPFPQNGSQDLAEGHWSGADTCAVSLSL